MKNLSLEELMKVVPEVDAKLYGPRAKKHLMKYIVEEAKELQEAAHQSDFYENAANKLEETKELGDLLYALIAYSIQYEQDLAQALSLTITKIQERIKFDVYSKRGDSNGQK